MRACKILIAISLLFIFACPGLALGAGCFPEVVGSSTIPTNASGVFVSGNHAYVADAEFGLYVFDISNPAVPTMVGSLNLPDGGKRIFIEGSYAYVIDGSGYLDIISITDPTQPYIKKIVWVSKDAYRHFVSGGYVHVVLPDKGTMQDSWLVIDARNPAQAYITTFSCPFQHGYDIFIKDGIAYLKGANDVDKESLPVFATFDASDPANIKLPYLDVSVTGNIRGGLYVSGGYAYIGTSGYGIVVYDVRRAGSLLEVGGVSAPGFLNNIHVTGGVVYAAAEKTGAVHIIDAGDPSHPVLTGTIQTDGRASDIYQSGDYLYVANGVRGLQVISLNNQISPALVGSLVTPGTLQALDISGGYAYVAALDGGLQIFKISAPTRPSVAGQVTTPGLTKDVSIDGNYAFVADQGYGLHVVDISSKASPRIVVSADTPDNMPCSVYTTGGHAYLANGSHGLVIFDVTKPTGPVQASVFKTSSPATDVHVMDTFAYVATSEGLTIVDVTSPKAPVQVGAVKTDGPASSVQASGGFVFVLYDKGLAIIDVSKPGEAEIVSAYATPTTSAHHVYILGRHAYLVNEKGELQIIDVSDPTDPFLNTHLDLSNKWLGVQARGGEVFLVGVNQASWGIMEVVQACLY